MLLKSTSVWFPGPGLGVGILYHVIYFIVNKTQSNQPVGGPADRPIRDQFPGHVITLAQSEASIWPGAMTRRYLGVVILKFLFYHSYLELFKEKSIS